MFREIKKEANWTLKGGVQRLPKHSEQVQGGKYSLHRCLVFGEIKSEANWKQKGGDHRLPEHSEQAQ